MCCCPAGEGQSSPPYRENNIPTLNPVGRACNRAGLLALIAVCPRDIFRADAESVTESQGHAQHTSRNASRWIGWKPTFNRETLQTVVPFELVALDLGLRFFGHIVRVAGPPSMI